MDIKKLITRIEKIKYENLRYNSPESMLLEQKHLILDLVEQFDEQQKPVVPEFVAEWIEYAKKKGDSLRDSFKPWNLYGIEYSKADRWIDDNQETFAQAWLSGYEVEKEPLYRVKIGEGYFVEYQGRGALIMPDKNKEIKIFDSKSEAERTSSTIGGTVEEVSEKDEI